jgi:hypothetical protein
MVMDSASKSAAAICLVSLFLLCLAVFLPWVHVPVAGPGLGILRSDGVFLLIGTLLMGALAGTTLFRGVSGRTAFVCNAAWGTFVCTYLTGIVLGILRLRNHGALSENVFAQALLQFVQPGFGLFVGSFSALCLAASSSFLAVRQLSAPARSRLALGAHVVSILASAALGFGMTAFHFTRPTNLATNHSKAEPQSLMEAFEKSERDERQQEKNDRLKRAVAFGQSRTLGNVEVRPISVERRHVSGVRGIFRASEFRSEEPILVLTFEAKNVSEGQVFNPTSWVEVTDNFGNKLANSLGDDYDVRVDGSENRKELKPGESARMVFCRKTKIATSTSYDWEVHTRTSNSENTFGASESWIVHVDEHDIVAQAVNTAGEVGDEAANAEIENAINAAIDQAIAVLRSEITKQIADDKEQRDRTELFLKDPEVSKLHFLKTSRVETDLP